MQNREFNVEIIWNGEKKVLKARKGRRLKELIFDAGISFALPCGGNGRCGKCVIEFTSGAPSPNSSDQNFLTEREISSGKRILCRCVLEKECTVNLDKSHSEENIVVQTIEKRGNKALASGKASKICAAIDIGTTTIAMALIAVDSEKKEAAVIDTASSINHQRQFGVDVINRIEASSDKETAQKLRSFVQEDILTLLKTLLDRNSVTELSDVCIAGNTTMLHLLRGYDASGLGTFPYKPESLEMESLELSELLSLQKAQQALLNARAVILPGISAFVGADIVAGILFTGILEKEPTKKALFVDLGTNGEMAFFDGQKLKVTSTAAGPVFEGGEISCGVASIPGAISHVHIKEGKEVTFETIGDIKPIGLCGTGVIEAVSELVKNRIVDETGLLSDEYFDSGFEIVAESGLRITREDIRKVQLAKAAIRAGIEKLCGNEAPDMVYVAGGFGSNMDIDKLKSLKMFPKDMTSNILTVGNTSLKGCIRYLCDPDTARFKLLHITEITEEEILALDENFGADYMRFLQF